MQPLTGLDEQGFNKFERRSKLPPGVREQCARLDMELPRLKAVEQQAKGQGDKDDVAKALFRARSRYHEMKC
ncbi:hypothetical protein [Pelomonas sp. KK5]|uniref:hypothetical protein n=1 Tax=Pelomonas sp. KK5 TaxID=1855730 RepID=UPI00097C150D|nr:hypothetical protein [Pelomonas sp. KK5]